jgi:hypothetical protein
MAAPGEQSHCTASERASRRASSSKRTSGGRSVVGLTRDDEREDRAGSRQARIARADWGRLSTPTRRARPPDLRRPCTTLRGLRRQRRLPREPRRRASAGSGRRPGPRENRHEVGANARARSGYFLPHPRVGGGWWAASVRCVTARFASWPRKGFRTDGSSEGLPGRSEGHHRNRSVPRPSGPRREPVRGALSRSASNPSRPKGDSFARGGHPRAHQRRGPKERLVAEPWFPDGAAAIAAARERAPSSPPSPAGSTAWRG